MVAVAWPFRQIFSQIETLKPEGQLREEPYLEDLGALEWIRGYTSKYSENSTRRKDSNLGRDACWMKQGDEEGMEVYAAGS